MRADLYPAGGCAGAGSGAGPGTGAWRGVAGRVPARRGVFVFHRIRKEPDGGVLRLPLRRALERSVERDAHAAGSGVSGCAGTADADFLR